MANCRFNSSEKDMDGVASSGRLGNQVLRASAPKMAVHLPNSPAGCMKNVRLLDCSPACARLVCQVERQHGRIHASESVVFEHGAITCGVGLNRLGSLPPNAVASTTQNAALLREVLTCGED